jgi:hypothetical protein
MSDPEITPTQPDGPRENPHDGADTGRDRPSGDEIRLPEEVPAGDETVAADTASGGAPEPSGASTNE